MEYRIIRNDNEEGELYHYGVKGMKWGVRRKYPTIAQAYRKARQAGDQARKESIAKSRATDKGLGSGWRANKAANKARKEATVNSLKEQKQAVKEQKVSEKAKKQSNKKPMSTKKKVAIGAAVAGGVLAAYGANKFIRNANANIRGHRAVVDVLNNYVNPTVELYNKQGKFDANEEAIRKFVNNATSLARRQGINSASNDSLGTAIKNIYDEVKRYRK